MVLFGKACHRSSYDLQKYPLNDIRMSYTKSLKYVIEHENVSKKGKTVVARVLEWHIHTHTRTHTGNEIYWLNDCVMPSVHTENVSTLIIFSIYLARRPECQHRLHLPDLSVYSVDFLT